MFEKSGVAPKKTESFSLTFRGRDDRIVADDETTLTLVRKLETRCGNEFARTCGASILC